MQHDIRYHFLAQFFMTFVKTPFLYLDCQLQRILNGRLVSRANTLNQTNHTLRKGLKFWARKWCLLLCSFCLRLLVPLIRSDDPMYVSLIIGPLFGNTAKWFILWMGGWCTLYPKLTNTYKKGLHWLIDWVLTNKEKIELIMILHISPQTQCYTHWAYAQHSSIELFLFFPLSGHCPSQR